jgi:hypothetical protein
VAPLRDSTRSAARARGRRSDAGLLVIGTLTKLLLFVAVVATFGYDALSMLVTHVGVDDDAQEAATAGHDVLANHGTPQMAYAAVLKYAQEHDDQLVPGGFVIGTGNAVTVVLRREAHTIVSSHLPRVQNYVVATSTATSRNPLN